MSVLQTDPPFWAVRPTGRVAHFMCWREGDGEFRRPLCGELTPERADLLHPAGDDVAHCRMCTRKANAKQGRCEQCGCSEVWYRAGCMCCGPPDADCGCADHTLAAIQEGAYTVVTVDDADTLRRLLAYSAACRAV